MFFFTTNVFYLRFTSYYLLYLFHSIYAPNIVEIGIKTPYPQYYLSLFYSQCVLHFFFILPLSMFYIGFFIFLNFGV